MRCRSTQRAEPLPTGPPEKPWAAGRFRAWGKREGARCNVCRADRLVLRHWQASSSAAFKKSTASGAALCGGELLGHCTAIHLPRGVGALPVAALGIKQASESGEALQTGTCGAVSRSFTGNRHVLRGRNPDQAAARSCADAGPPPPPAPTAIAGSTPVMAACEPEAAPLDTPEQLLSWVPGDEDELCVASVRLPPGVSSAGGDGGLVKQTAAGHQLVFECRSGLAAGTGPRTTPTTPSGVP